MKIGQVSYKPLPNKNQQQAFGAATNKQIVASLEKQGVPVATAKTWVRNYVDHLVQQGNSKPLAQDIANQSVTAESSMLIFSLKEKINPFLTKVKK